MDEFICKYCNKKCKNRNSLAQHEIRCIKNPDHIHIYFNDKNFQKKLIETKEQSVREGKPIYYCECYCQYCNRKFTTKSSKTQHEKYCIQNPNHIKKIGYKISEEQKKKISESMKKAHKEGRAHNIGKSRWNNEPSYPEKWFIEMSLNEGINQNYIREFPFHKFSLDFAWVEQKKVIEIDGEQHLRDTKQKERDIEKDKLLLEEGWKELRISWSDICSNTKPWIKIIKDFINEGNSYISEEFIHDYKNFKKKQKEQQRQERENLQQKEKEKLIEERRKTLNEIDMNNFGWVMEVAKKWDISWTQTKRWIKKYYPDLKYYQRNSVDKKQ